MRETGPGTLIQIQEHECPASALPIKLVRQLWRGPIALMSRSQYHCTYEPAARQVKATEFFLHAGASGARGTQEILIFLIMHGNHIIPSHLRVISSTAMVPHAPFRMLSFLWSRFPFTPFLPTYQLLLGSHNHVTRWPHTIARACFDQPVPQLVSLFVSKPVTRIK